MFYTHNNMLNSVKYLEETNQLDTTYFYDDDPRHILEIDGIIRLAVIRRMNITGMAFFNYIDQANL